MDPLINNNLFLNSIEKSKYTFSSFFSNIELNKLSLTCSWLNNIVKEIPCNDSKSAVKGTILSFVTKFPQAKAIRIHKKNIITPDDFMNLIKLKNLHTLDIKNNKSNISSDVFNYVINDLKNLKNLNVSNCRFITTNYIIHFNKLDFLSLKGLEFDEKSLDTKYISNIKKIIFGCNKFTDEYLSKLTGVEDLDISVCYECKQKTIKGTCFEKMKNLRKLNIGNCYGIEPTSFKFLNKIEVLECDFDDTFANYTALKITDDCIHHLKNVKILNVFNQRKLTDDALKNLKNIQDLTISLCNKMTNNAMQYLKGIKRLTIAGLKKIDGSTFHHISGIEELYANSCKSLTDENFIHLKGIKKLYISKCNNLTDEVFKHLSGIDKLEINNNVNITGKNFNYIDNIRSLHLKDCCKIKKEYIQNLKATELNLEDCLQINNNFLEYMPQVDYLNISGTNTNRKGIEKIKNIPNLKIGSSKLNSVNLNLQNIKTLHIYFSYNPDFDKESFKFLPKVEKLLITGWDVKKKDIFSTIVEKPNIFLVEDEVYDEDNILYYNLII